MRCQFTVVCLILGRHDLLDSVHQRVVALTANVPEVIEVQGPDHGPTQAHPPNVLGLVSDHVLVVIGDPLIPLVKCHVYGHFVF